MKQSRHLGKTTIEVNPVGLGAMALSLVDRPEKAVAFEVIKSFVENGGNFIDTANVYCVDDTDIGRNERLIAQALKRLNKNSDVLVATKGGLKRPNGDWVVDASPQCLRSSCEQSLLDLDSDSLFLYYLHSPDPDVPITDSVGELVRLKEQGKIRHIGLSNVTVEQIKQALSVTDIVAVQNRANLFERKSFDNGVIDYCDHNDISFIAHGPTGGHYRHTDRSQNPLLNQIAKRYQVSPYQIMIAWLLHKSPSIMAIPGATKTNSIKDSLQAINVKLNQEDMQQLDATKE